MHGHLDSIKPVDMDDLVTRIDARSSGKGSYRNFAEAERTTFPLRSTPLEINHTVRYYY